ncbi:unnamed protein product, partial [Brassica rapa subsp. trilocularis]
TQNPSRLLLAVNLISILHQYQPVVPVAPLSLILCFAFVYLASLFSFLCQYVCLLCYLDDDVSFRCIGGIRKVLEWQLSPICQLLCVCGSWNQR